jgi:KRAB domain-containing zinc finger protein
MIFFKKYQCEKCNDKFRKIEELMQHTQIIHGKNLLYECRHCGVSFTGMQQMRNHIQRAHSYNKIKHKTNQSEYLN